MLYGTDLLERAGSIAKKPRKDWAMLRHFETGDTLFRQGDPSDFAVLIVAGSADVLRHAGDDAIVLGQIHAGEFVGEMGVLDGQPRSATVRAASAVDAELIERQAFLDRVERKLRR